MDRPDRAKVIAINFSAPWEGDPAQVSMLPFRASLLDQLATTYWVLFSGTEMLKLPRVL